ITEMPGTVFASNPKLTTFKFLGSSALTKFNGTTFSNDPVLESFEIPSGVTEIGRNTFQNTPKLTTVTFKEPASITTIGANAFASSGITSIELPSTVTTIRQQAFDNCTNLTTIGIPASVTSIETGTFNMCDNLTAINVDANNTIYSSLDGMLCDKNKKELVVFPAGKADTRYTLIPNFTTVKSYAFYGSQKVTNITFPATITTIENYSIALCDNLKSLSFMGTDNVPTLTSNIMYQSGNAKDVTIYVRKAWYENSANASTVSTYDTTFKEVHPSFVSLAGYDRGTEFFPTSTSNVGVISYYTPRTSVIINPEATETTYTDVYGKTWPTKTYEVSSILDYAYQNETTVKDIVVLADVGVIGLDAFRAGSQLKGIYFVGDTPTELNSTDYEMNSTDYAFNENQNIYVKESKVPAYQAAWEVDGHTLNITHKIPVTTYQHGGTMCYPFDVRFPQGLGDDNIKPYIPLNYDAAYDATNPIVRAYSVDDYYVPAFVGVFFRSKSKASVASSCQMDEAQAHSTATIEGMGYDAAGYRMLGMVEDSLTVNEAGYNRYAFSKSSGKLVLLKDGALVPYFKAVLRMPDSAGSQSKSFSLRFSDDEGTATGIDGVADRSTVEDAAAPVYDLNGVKVSQPRGGIYVRNGKKIVIK
ncbi:MAG: leucine-rich repeat domain-containing protein, partial [Bacteroidaceae bacterium]|nr:leucine-rich repeat domain-containing protein [Bacteroidaceae bacterium]